MGIRLSLLDQTPVGEGISAVEAFGQTLEFAQKAEALGYHRFWVSEHHDSDGVVGSSPEVLIAYLLAKTNSIRIGSGGVMLQHYSPYKVAENFNVLASLAPGRVDLGIGRAPGGLPRSAKALQLEAAGKGPTLADKLILLNQYIHDTLEETNELHGVKAVPIPEEPAKLFLLGGGGTSTELAASLGIPYVFAQFITGDESVITKAFDSYRQHFSVDAPSKPHTILAVSIILTDEDEEAKALAADVKNVKVHLESGRTVTVKTTQQAEEFGKQSGEKYTIEEKEANIIHGSKETVRRKLLDLYETYKLDEIVIIVAMKEFKERLRAIVLLQEAFSELTV
ncbi:MULTISPECIES: LLM class flavin-dependent oxidoreductase [unclassified Paenibacillus]|uniref:LLM class flavin-dependent oxidoreductase n=1 Tax=unclassified Paenibacillus TaxID=185978 RepID=UPI0027875CD5|nr:MULTISPECIES: LLM class flavin-dependent oxidoreductase [unclassified Paenibacillus]MDF2650431.1 alkane 1-monooxygenase [Paenibacillus sp.]MDQ0901216.1 luciferase family oxidoreductase group 1 [Paenibacillus sp. V4I7]MDQ0920287.1 luciferase family oxidoreductase group 1 [Paenibacillus sp. V4I5]